MQIVYIHAAAICVPCLLHAPTPPVMTRARAKVAARPHSLKTSYYELGFDQRRSTSNATSLDNPSSYYFLADEDQFKLDVSYIIGEVLKSEFKDRHLSGAGMGCQGHNICDEARENRASYACRCKNSECYNDRATDGLKGYTCSCSGGYQGNPYPKDGGQDIDECSRVGQNRCPQGSDCINRPDDCTCKCAPGYSSEDPNNKYSGTEEKESNSRYTEEKSLKVQGTTPT